MVSGTESEAGWNAFWLRTDSETGWNVLGFGQIAKPVGMFFVPDRQ